MSNLLVINAVGLTPRLLKMAPRLAGLAKNGWYRPLREVLPAVTCTAQATLLTGQMPDRHGIVANGWLFRDTGEVRFWQQSSRLVQSPLLYDVARRRASEKGRSFRCAKLFWWFNQGAGVDISVTPKPYYGADGSKAFGITGTPPEMVAVLEQSLGPFPFPSFWGPMSGIPASQWIARCGAEVLRRERPSLTLVYLPHLDYDPQRLGPQRADMARLVLELDQACAPLLEAASDTGMRTWVVSEYGHVQVSHAVLPNRLLRLEGLLAVRPGPFGEMLDTFASRAFAVCDHQLAHVYVRQAEDVPRAGELITSLPGVARAVAGEERRELGLAHERAGEIIALAKPDAWFAYPYWLTDDHAPDFARTVDIHRKPGFDPCELFFDPALRWPRGRALRRLVQKKLGFRTLFDVVPLDPSLVGGSHGLPASDPEDRPVLIGDGPAPAQSEIPMTAVADLILGALDLMP